MTSKDRDLLEKLLRIEQESYTDFTRQVEVLEERLAGTPKWRWLLASNLRNQIREIRLALLLPSAREQQALLREMIDLRAAERESRRTS